jgi:hypothetical protein
MNKRSGNEGHPPIHTLLSGEGCAYKEQAQAIACGCIGSYIGDYIVGSEIL